MNWAMERAVEPIADHYGIINQLNILQEECGELIQAASKVLRSRARCPHTPEDMQAVEKLFEEIADVEIMLAQVKYLLGPETGNRVDSIAATKIVRQKARIEEDRKAPGCNGDCCPVGKAEA